MPIQWREGPDPLSSGDEPQLPTAAVYRGVFQTALTAATLYAGYKMFGQRLANYGNNLTKSFTRQSSLLKGQLLGFETYGGGRALGSLQRGEYGRAAGQLYKYATAPLRNTFGARAPAIAESLTETSRLLYGFKGVPEHVTLSAWRNASVAPSNGAVRNLLLGDVLALPRNAPILDKTPYNKNSLGGSLRMMRAQLLRIQKLEARGSLPGGTLSAFTNVPVDNSIFRTRGGRVVDLRSFHPDHWGRDVWNRFAFPEMRIPQGVPFYGGEELPISRAKPLAWLTNLFMPTELLRKQPILKGARMVGPEGKEFPFLFMRGAQEGNLRSLTLKDQWGNLISSGTPIPSPKAMRKRYPFARLEFEVGAVVEENTRLVGASSPVGKGIRIRQGLYKHDLAAWMEHRGIPEDKPFGQFLKFMDWAGIGPHLTAPQVFEEELQGGGIRKVAHNKIGAFEHTVRNILGLGNRVSTHLATHSPLALGESNLERFVSLQASGVVDRAFGNGMLGKMAQGVADFANYSTLRPLYLMEEQLGLGLKPGRNIGSSLFRIGSRVIIPAYFMAQGLRYFDFKAGQTLGISPSDVLLDSYAGAQVLRAKALEKTGLQDLADTTEELMPGSISSPISGILRSVLGGAAGAVLGGSARRALERRSPLFGHNLFAVLMPLLGAATGSFLAGNDPRTTSTSLRRQYSGEELVPIKRSRWWELGRDSFYGRDIMYYRPHLLAMRRHRTWEKSIYGSEANYWKHGTALSPMRYLDPYWLERQHQHDRPYPETGPFFGDGPIVGAALEGTVGRVLKPVQQHPLLEQSMEQMGERWAGERGVPEDVGQRLALPPTTAPNAEGVTSRFRPGQLFGKLFNSARDWAGMSGFLWSAAVEKITGNKSPFGGERQLETSDRMASVERRFYGMELGGGFQTLPVPGSGFLATEFLRRFIPHRDRSIELVNPIPNNMPDWLPGPRAAFEKDRNFYLPGGFHTGDPYTKIPLGDVRLPGPGYESVRPLHSGIPGVYDPVDRLLILEDVAPYAESTKHYRTIVQAWAKAGVLDDSWKQQILESSVRKERRAASKSFGVKNLHEEPGTIPISATIEKVTSPTTFKTYEYPYTFRVAGFETSTKKLYAQQLESANSATYSEAVDKVKAAREGTKAKLQALVGQQIELQISADQASRYSGGKIMALVPGINPGAILRSKDQEGLAAYTRGNATTRAIANAYYGAATVEPIDPVLGWLKNKLLPIRDPVEDYYKFQVLGNRFGMWETPVKSYLKPWLQNIPGQIDHIPPDTAKRRQAFRDFEALKYLKTKRLEERAKEVGDTALAEQFGKDLNRTYLGMNPRSPRQAAFFMKQAVSPAERDYIESFKNLHTTAARKRALSLVPEESKYILSNLWQQDLPTGVKLENEDLSSTARRYSPWQYPRESLNEFLATKDVPAAEWDGWDPRVSLDAAKIKWIENQGDNIHNYGLWQSEQRKFHRQFPNMQAPVLQPQEASAIRVHNNLSKLGLEVMEERGGILFDYAGQARLEIELRRARSRDKGYDNKRRRLENNRAFFPEPA